MDDTDLETEALGFTDRDRKKTNSATPATTTMTIAVMIAVVSAYAS